jgi:2,3-bisphosphoglycerate-independent phosphoglycerate mutase
MDYLGKEISPSVKIESSNYVWCQHTAILQCRDMYIFICKLLNMSVFAVEAITVIIRLNYTENFKGCAKELERSDISHCHINVLSIVWKRNQ